MSHKHNRATATTSSVELTERCNLYFSDHTHWRHGGICDYSPEARNNFRFPKTCQDENLIRLISSWNVECMYHFCMETWERVYVQWQKCKYQLSVVSELLHELEPSFERGPQSLKATPLFTIVPSIPIIWPWPTRRNGLYGIKLKICICWTRTISFHLNDMEQCNTTSFIWHHNQLFQS